MMYLRLSEEASCDVREICRWYETRQRGLSRSFRTELKKLSESIRANPERFAEDEYFPGIRVGETARFPYLVYYVFRGNEVEIRAVLHSGRDSASFGHRFH